MVVYVSVLIQRQVSAVCVQTVERCRQLFVDNIFVTVSSFKTEEVPQFFVVNVPVIMRVSSFKMSCGTCGSFVQAEMRATPHS